MKSFQLSLARAFFTACTLPAAEFRNVSCEGSYPNPAMKTKLSTLLALLASFLPFSACLAALPERSQVVQAESMTLDGEGWTVREHSLDAWYASRPVGQMLGGQNNKPGVAAATFQISAAGKYRIWVRYLDMVNYRSKSGFRLSGTQQGKRVAQKEFDNTEASPRSTPEGEKKWGDGFARWIWDFVEFDAAAGPVAGRCRESPSGFRSWLYPNVGSALAVRRSGLRAGGYRPHTLVHQGSNAA